MGQPTTLRAALPGLGRLFRRLWPYVRRERPLIVVSLIALYAEIGLRLLEPWPLKVVLDHVLRATTHDRWMNRSLAALDPRTLLVLAAACVVVFAGLRAAAAYWNTVGLALAGNRVLTAVRNELYLQLQRLSLSFHTRARIGDLIVRVTGDVGFLQDVVVTAFLPLLASGLTFVGMAIVMLWLNAPLALLAFATGPLFLLSTIRISRRISDNARRQRQQQGAMAATAAESIGAVKVVHALSLEGTFAQAFTKQSRKNLATGAAATRLEAALDRTVDLLIAVATALVLWAGARLVLRGGMTPGDLIVFLAYLRTAFRPAKDFAKYTGRLAKASAAGERVVDLLDRTPDVRDLPGAVPAPALRGAVHFEGVSFAYEPAPARPALEAIDCTIEPGQHVALFGPSGSGKSTFASLILRLYDPTAGRILLDGRDLREYTLASVRAQISVVLQDSILFVGTIRDNIGYGAPSATPAAIEAAARLANAHGFITALPQGYDTVVGERGMTLSNGQRQRIAIARAAIRQAPIIILDEPTTGLDRENAQAVGEALERLAEGRTTFLITHDADLAARAHLFFYMDAGRVQQTSTPPPRATLPSPPEATFVRADGRPVRIVPGFRDRALSYRESVSPRPGWTPDEYARAAAKKLNRARHLVTAVERRYGVLDRSTVLDVGCGDGIDCVVMAYLTHARVVGTDLRLSLFDPGETGGGKEATGPRRLATDVLARLDGGRSLADTLAELSVRFTRADATTLPFPDDQFDVLLSRSALEHIVPVERALAEMARVVRGDGVIHHAVDPYYWLRGCHKRGLVDIPWAHARLSLEDFARFVTEHEGIDVATRRLRRLQTLNRLTLAQWRAAIDAGPFDILEWTEETSPFAAEVLAENPDVIESLMDGVEPRDLVNGRLEFWLRVRKS